MEFPFAFGALRDQLWVLNLEKKRMQLSDNCVLVYVLSGSGCLGRLRSGQVERESGGLNVYDSHTRQLVEYFSGANIRSWCVFGPDKKPVSGWASVAQEDLPTIFPPSGRPPMHAY